MSELVGRTLLERYQVREFLGRGGMAEVYKVWDAHRNTNLAMKVLHEELALDQVFMRRFQREADTLAQLQHPNIVRFYSLEQEGPLAFMLLDYIDGETLKRLIFESGGPVDPGQILAILRPICGALQFAHDEGRVHCDIKPGNIMIHRNGTPLVADFGIARMTDAATTTLAGIGTPAYMAPEQIMGDDPTPATDIYALGIVLFEMLTGGERPFTGEQAQTTGSTTEKVRWEHIHLEAPSPRTYNPNLPAGQEAVVMKCLAKDPRDRFESAMALFAALEQASFTGEETAIETLVAMPPATEATLQEETPIPAEGRQSPREEAARRERTNLIILALFAAALVAVLGIYALTRPGGGDSEGTATAESLGTQVAMVAATGTAAAFAPPATSTPEATNTLPPPSPTPEGTDTPIPPTPTPAMTPLSGEGTVQLTFDEQDYYKPALTRDQGRMVAFALIGPTRQIVEVDPRSGGVLRQVSRENANHHHPQFSIDGETLLASSDRNGYFNIYLFSYESGEIIRQLTDSQAVDMTPDWFPDGQRFAFMSNRDGDYEVYIGFLDGSPPEQLTHNEAYDGSTVVSPDGKWIAFYSNRSGSPNVYLLEVESGEEIQLTDTRARDAEPDFSPDGEWVAFESDRDGNYDIWVIRTDGSELRKVTHSLDPEQVPVFSPDGKWIFYQAKPGDGYDLYRIPWR